VDGEVVVHLLHDSLGERDQSIFSELGFFDVDRPLFLSIVVLEQMQGLGDSHAASGHEQDGHIQSKLFEKGDLASLHCFADVLEQLIGLLGREDERNDNLFFERRDIEQGILLKDSSSYQETKETPGDREHMVDRGGLQIEIGSHVKEKRRVKGGQIRSTLMQITIKAEEMICAGLGGIPEAFPITEIVVKLRGEETFKGFHGKGPFSSDRRGCGGTFG
jgi:hypothetical protein